MNAKVEPSRTAADTVKLILAVLILGAGIYGFYYLEGETLTWIRVLGLLAVAGLAAFVASLSAQGKTLIQFFSDARGELQKIVWPTRQETIQTTLIILVVVLIIGIVLWLMDWTFAKLIGLLVG